MRNRNNKVVVFDLDETLGYFSELGLFFDLLQEYKNKELSKNYIVELLDLYPEFLRTNIMGILNYLKAKKQSGDCRGVYIYTNNQGPKSWAEAIKNYFQIKLGDYKLFDKTIAAFKVGGKKVEMCRTSHTKTVKDFLACTRLPKNTKIFFLDDQEHPNMDKDSNVIYIHLEPYIYDLTGEEMVYRYLKSPLGEDIKDKEDFKNYILKYMRQENINSGNIVIYKQEAKNIMLDLQTFLERKHNKTVKRRDIAKNKTMRRY